MSFLQGKVGSDGHYYEERLHSSGQTYVVRDGHEIASGLTSDPGYSGRFMDSLGGHNTRPRENSSTDGGFFGALSNFGGSNKKTEQKKSWLDF